VYEVNLPILQFARHWFAGHNIDFCSFRHTTPPLEARYDTSLVASNRFCKFLIICKEFAEYRWEDKLKILHWSDYLAAYEDVEAACGTVHVRELVVPWMTTGSLRYPFARAFTRADREKRPRFYRSRSMTKKHCGTRN